MSSNTTCVYEAPASLGQRLLWFMDHYRGADGALNCPIVFRMRGTLDSNALRRSLEWLAERHHSLRTTFKGRGRRLTQIIHPPGPIELDEYDLRGEANTEGAWREQMQNQLRANIDPTTCSLRVSLWTLGDDDHVLCVNLHHLITDGQSYGIFVRELHQLYDRAVGVARELPAIRWQYADFARWEAAELQSAEFKQHLAYWQQQLRGSRMPSLPFAPRSGAHQARNRETRVGSLPAGAAAALKELARDRHVTLFTVLLSLFYVLLHRHTGERDLCVSSVFLNRHRPEVQDTMGFFANLLVLRLKLPASARFSDVLRSCYAMVTEAFTHQCVPYHVLPAHLMRETNVRFDDLVFQMTQPLDRNGMGGMRVDTLPVEGVGNRFDLELTLISDADTVAPVVSYNAARVSRAWAHTFLAQYERLALSLAARGDMRVDDLSAALDSPGAI